MCKFLSDSILQGAVVAPAEVPSYRGLLALVQFNMEDYDGDLTALLNPTLKILGYSELEHSVVYDSICPEDAVVSYSAVIRLPDFGSEDPFLNLVVTLLGYEKHYAKCYLSKVNRTESTEEFFKIVNLVIDGILVRLEGLADKVGVLSDGLIDVLCMHYLTMIMEISLLWHINLFKELFPALAPVFSRRWISNDWIDEALHNYKIIECCNSVKKFIQERYAFSLQRVSEVSSVEVSGTLRTLIKEALVLYRNLTKLLMQTADEIMQCELRSCMSVMENYLYFAYSGQPVPQGNWMSLFSDKQQCLSIAAELEKEHYSPYILSQGTARGAYENIHSFLNSDCFTFLNGSINSVGSIPRHLLEFLLDRKAMYAGIYNSTLDPVYKEKDGSVTENLYLKYSFERCNSILSEMDYMSKGNSDEYILDENELEKLKRYFLEFCKLGYIRTMPDEEKVKVNRNKQRCLYGFFCNIIGTTDNGTTDCFNFLEGTVKGFKITKESNFKKGRAAYIDAYKEHKNAYVIPYL